MHPIEIFVVLVVVGCLGIGVGYASGKAESSRNWKKALVQQGMAKYEVNPTNGSVTFVFIKP